jgi:restriction system protein
MNAQPLVPTHIDLMWPTIEAIKQLGGSGANQEIFDKIIENEKYPEEIQEVIQRNNVTKLQYRTAWARSFLKMADVITNSSRGIWSFTKDGENTSQEEILNRIKEKRQDYYQNRKPTVLLADKEEESPKENATEWKEDLLETLKLIKPDSFERLCLRVLRESGFSPVKVTGKSGDGGIDGIGILRVNLLSFQVLFQCKRYRGRVGPSEVRDFRGAMMGRCDKGLLITTGSFTNEARKEATRDGAFAVDLIDVEELCELLKNLQLGVKTQMIETVIVEPDWFESL